MKIFDLSHTIKPGMPAFPGTDPPVFVQGNTVEKDGFAEKKITFFSHTGTHIDAPAHILKTQPNLDQLPINSFIGQALCINLAETAIKTIQSHHLQPYTYLVELMDFVLFATGWSRHWGSEQYFEGFPVLSENAAKLLCQHHLKGVGFDTISADRTDSHNLPIHKILLQKMFIIENLTNLETIPGDPFLFSCLPLKIDNGDGSPIRAVAICGDITEKRVFF